MLKNWMVLKKEQIKQYLVASSVVITSRIIAEVLNMAFKVQRPSRPNKIVTTYNTAVQFLSEQCLQYDSDEEFAEIKPTE